MMLKIDEKEVEYYAKSATLCEFKALEKIYKVYLIGCPHKYASDVGNILSDKKECDFAVMWRYSFPDNTWTFSCRSSKNCPDIDLSSICSQFDSGGGHKHAAGFTISNNVLGLGAYFKLIC